MDTSEGEEITEPKEENILAKGIVNNYYLGNILREVFEKLHKNSSEKQSEEFEPEVLICLMGY